MKTLTRWTAAALAAVLALLCAVPPLLAAAADRGAVVVAGGFLAVADALDRTVFGWMHPALRSAGIVNAKGAKLADILKELKKLQDDHRGKAMPEDMGKKFEELAAEAKGLQDEFDRDEQIKSFEKFGREIPDPAMPADGPAAAKAAPIVGYISLGQAFTASEQFKNYLAAGRPQGGSMPFRVKGLAGEDRFIGLTAEGLKKLQETWEGKAIPTIGAGVIQPDRISEIVRDSEPIRLTMRDLLNVSRTSSNAIEYLAFTPAATPAAAPVAENAAKPETTFILDDATSPVRTLAVWIPVTEQQLQDIPQVEGIIDTELRYELKLVEERQVTWADGTGQNLLGIFQTPGVAAGRTVGGDTLLDKIRRSITDVRVSGNEPNGVILHPYESEALDLLKGTDSHYVWVVITDDNGRMRVWGLTKVESVAMQEPGSYTTNERRVLVGDFVRGATLWDRLDATVQVGWQNDDFTKNRRTIRGEERVAFGVKRPAAFKYVVAQARVA
jgi:HK97 family phage major capsid protein